MAENFSRGVGGFILNIGICRWIFKDHVYLTVKTPVIIFAMVCTIEILVRGEFYTNYLHTS